MARSSLLCIAAVGLAAALSPVGCFGFGTGTMDSPPPAADASTPPPLDIPFEAVPPEVYVARAKNLLVGLAPTDEEVRAVTADKAALAGLIDGWMATPQYRDKMLGFFANAFQQTQLDPQSIRAMIRQEGDAGVNPTIAPLLLGNMRESFARTVWQLVSEGRPFNEAITTERVMLTPPLAALYAFLDADHVDDDGKTIDRTVQQNPAFEFTVTSEGPIPIEETLDPASPNHMHWYNPDVASSSLAVACRAPSRVYKSSDALYQLLFGSLGSITLDGVKCPIVPGSSNAGQFALSEFEDWRMVTIRKPRAGEATTPFYDLGTLRTTNEIVLRTPHIGFFGTPAFFANWGTNKSNLGRVTVNQTLIVALGHSFDGSHSITPVSEAGLDGAHAAPGSVCFGCHQTLDPMREFFRQAYTLNYHDQTDPNQSSIQGVFAFDGVTAQGHGLGDLAFQLASHPRFAEAWAQKLCTYANAAPCVVDDPEFMRIVDAFKSSGFSWSVLVRELFASPITTNVSKTMTASQIGVTVPISRRDHFCAALSNRLGVPNACGLAGGAALTPSQEAAHRIATNMPSDGYSRGAESPMLANDPNIFFRAGAENICRNMADQLVDAPQGGRYSSQAPDAAVADLVATVMALTAADPRAEPARGILFDHFTAATKGGPPRRTPSNPRSSWPALRLRASLLECDMDKKSEMKNVMLGRREVLMHTLFGAGAIGLRALATGLPAALLASPRTAFADEKAAACFSSDKAQFVIWSTSAAGDPLNANVPGTYDDPNIAHSLDPAMAKTPITLGGQTYNAARAWSALPQSTLDRTCFFHHSTQTNSHSNQAKVMELMGATKDQEMLVSVLARQLAPCLGTIQTEPLTLGAVGPAEALRYGGRALPLLTPSALGATLASPTGPLANLQKMRDADLSRLNDLYRREGTAVQRDFLDRYATSQSQVRLLSQDLLSTLDGIKDDSPASQIAAAIALIRMKVAPVLAIHIPFGGDNHGDPNLQTETTQTVSGVKTIALLMQQLAAAGLEDRVTFVSLNVFGRTLSLKQGRAGRGHHADHHCTVMIGKPIRAGVIGGVAPLGTDFGALAIDSRTGRGDPNGDIAFADTLASVGKTIGAAVGVDPNAMSTAVTSGKVVPAALA